MTRYEFLRDVAIFTAGTLSGCGPPEPPPTPDIRPYGPQYDQYALGNASKYVEIPTGAVVPLVTLPYESFENLVGVAAEREPVSVFSRDALPKPLPDDLMIPPDTTAEAINTRIQRIDEIAQFTILGDPITFGTHTVTCLGQNGLLASLNTQPLSQMLKWIHTDGDVAPFLTNKNITQVVGFTAFPNHPMYPNASGITTVGQADSGEILAYTIINLPTTPPEETIARVLFVELVQGAINFDEFPNDGTVFQTYTSDVAETLANSVGEAYDASRSVVIIPTPISSIWERRPPNTTMPTFGRVHRISVYPNARPIAVLPPNFLTRLITRTFF